MRQVIEILKELGYPLSSVLVILVLGYFGKRFFEKVLDVFIEEKKTELTRETERLKTTLEVEAETYRLAARKRFSCLMELWQSSESLFADTDFSDIDSITKGLQKVNNSVAKLNRYSVLLSPEVVDGVRHYLRAVARVLTNSEEKFRTGTTTDEKHLDAALRVAGAAAGVAAGLFVPGVGDLLSLMTELALSKGKALETFRKKAADKARLELQDLLRREFGVWVAQEKRLTSPNTSLQPMR